MRIHIFIAIMVIDMVEEKVLLWDVIVESMRHLFA